MTAGDALELLTHCDLHALGALTDAEVRRRFATPVRTYIVDRNINFTNICTSGCSFCNFCRTIDDTREGYVLPIEAILEKIQELVDLGGRQVLMQGGLHPSLSFKWYLELLRTIKSHFPHIHLHSFSPPEIIHFSKLYGMPLDEVLTRLQTAGLDTLPGGGAEILVDRVRQIISPRKATTQEWLAVMEHAHRLGMRTTATMMFGHVETLAERIDHLQKIRDLQDRTGGFTAFIPWPFQPKGTRLAAQWNIQFSVSVQEYLRTLAVSRLFLDNVENIQASWVTQGPAVGQVALKFGANDFGSLMLEENVVASAGVRFHLREDELRGYIIQAGYQPSRRDCYYRLEA